MDPRAEDRDRLEKAISEPTCPIEIAKLPHFSLVTRFLTSQLFVTTPQSPIPPFLKFVVKMSQYYQDTPWVTLEKDTNVRINFLPVIWMLIQIHNPDMRTLLTGALAGADDPQFKCDFCSFLFPERTDDERELFDKLLLLTELSDSNGDCLERLISDRWNDFCALCDLGLCAVILAGGQRPESPKEPQKYQCTWVVPCDDKPSFDDNDKDLKSYLNLENERNAQFLIAFQQSGSGGSRFEGISDWIVLGENAVGVLLRPKSNVAFSDSRQGGLNSVIEVTRQSDFCVRYELYWDGVDQDKRVHNTLCQPVSMRIIDKCIAMFPKASRPSVDQCNLACALHVLYPSSLSDKQQDGYSSLVSWMYYSLDLMTMLIDGSYRGGGTRICTLVMSVLDSCVGLQGRGGYQVDALTIVLLAICYYVLYTYDDIENAKYIGEGMYQCLKRPGGHLEDSVKAMGDKIGVVIERPSERPTSHRDMLNKMKSSERPPCAASSVISYVTSFLQLVDYDAPGSLWAKHKELIKNVDKIRHDDEITVRSD